MQRRFGLNMKKAAAPVPPKKAPAKKGAKKPFKPRGMRLAWSWTYRGYSFVTENNTRNNTAKLYTIDVNSGERLYHLTTPIKSVKAVANELVKIFIAEAAIATLAGSHINQAEQLPEQTAATNGKQVYHAAEVDD